VGEKNRRLERFFAEHPSCCFCAGERPATTEDHQPGRIFFRNREWPEGFSFPACFECNQVSRTSERILGVLVHGHADDEDRSVYRKNLESVRAEFPDEIKRMLTPRIEQRRILKSAGIALARGVALDDVPIVTMRYDFWEPHFTMLARKLLLALHYQCFAQPLSRTGGIWHHIHTNFDFAAKKYPAELLDVANRLATPVRNKRFLNDQFLVRWNVANDSPTAVFVAQLQKRLVVTGFTTDEPNRFGENDIPPLRPFGPWSDEARHAG
jgi:hypothetical protein